MSNLVAIVGRPNVGKSTLFNRLTKSRRAIVNDEAGTTRDRQYGLCEWCGRDFSVVDTGGWVVNSEDIFEEEINRQVAIAIEEADVIMFVVDVRQGLQDADSKVADMLRRSHKPVVLVVNKVDKQNCRPDEVNEQVFDLMFTLGATEEQLDYKTIYGSAKQGWMSHVVSERTDSIAPLLDTIIDEIPEPETVEGTVQMLVTSLEYSPYVGRIAVGRIREMVESYKSKFKDRDLQDALSMSVLQFAIRVVRLEKNKEFEGLLEDLKILDKQLDEYIAGNN